MDPETGYKVDNIDIIMSPILSIYSWQECFRVFSKDQDGCITADEMKFVFEFEWHYDVSWVLQVRVDALTWENNLQRNRWDDNDSWQEWGLENILLRI